MMKLTLNLKRAIVAAGAVTMLATAGLPDAAQALTVNTGGNEFILAIYGNGTEYLANLSGLTGQTAAQLSAPGANTVVPLSGITSAVTGPDPVVWSIFSVENPGGGVVGMKIGHVLPFSLWNAGDATSSFPAQAFSVANPVLPQTNAFPGNPELIAASSGRSYSAGFSGNAPDSFGAYTQTVQELPGNLLHLVLGTQQGAVKSYSDMGHALLASDLSQITITGSPVPLPAAVVLFGTGLIGLVGVARRKLSGRA